MKKPLQARPAKAHQPQGHAQRMLRLADLPDAITVSQFCGVFQISEGTFHAWKRHGALPVAPLDLPGDIRFSNAAVARFLNTESAVRKLKRKVA